MRVTASSSPFFFFFFFFFFFSSFLNRSLMLEKGIGEAVGGPERVLLLFLLSPPFFFP